MAAKTAITVAKGDGIGPEIMDATLSILDQAGAALEYDFVEIGEKVYLKGHNAGITQETWDSLRRTKVFLKAPITTPQGGGFKSLNVTIRTALGLYANVRPCTSLYPFVDTKHPKMDVVIVRENEEDLYAGIEYRQSQEVCQSIKIISRSGTERIVRFAFEYARKHGRKKVTCFTKDNIMKLSDGLFHRVFDELAAQYPDIQNEHWIVDIGAAKLADTPEAFDVVVLPNLYGDILSDVAAQIAGSVGLAGSANIGVFASMFEAIHGSAPRRAGQNLANPSGLLQGAVQMLIHLNCVDTAATIQNAWLKTIEEGIHTYDIFKEGVSKQKVGTKEFAQAVIANLGKKPGQLPAVIFPPHSKGSLASATVSSPPKERKDLVGIDLYFEHHGPFETLFNAVKAAGPQAGLELILVTNRGAKLWPNGQPETTCVDTYRFRFMAPKKDDLVSYAHILKLLSYVADKKLDLLKTEHLYNFSVQAGYSIARDK